jgi:hypothetical protein
LTAGDILEAYLEGGRDLADMGNVRYIFRPGG